MSEQRQNIQHLPRETRDGSAATPNIQHPISEDPQPDVSNVTIESLMGGGYQLTIRDTRGGVRLRGAGMTFAEALEALNDWTKGVVIW